jgi:hypothetical protein
VHIGFIKTVPGPVTGSLLVPLEGFQPKQLSIALLATTPEGEQNDGEERKPN